MDEGSKECGQRVAGEFTSVFRHLKPRFKIRSFGEDLHRGQAEVNDFCDLLFKTSWTTINS